MTTAGKAQRAFPASIPTPDPKGTTMQTRKKSDAWIVSPRPAPAPVRSMTARLWRSLPTVVKIVLTVPLILALLGAEIELRIAPQFDVLLTAGGIWAVWAWLSDGHRPGA